MTERPARSKLGRIVAAVVLVAYPLLVWRGLAAGSPRTIALLLLVVLLPAALLRMRGKARRQSNGLLAIPLVTVASLGLASLLNSSGFILAVPVAINIVFVITFGATLRGTSMPMVERFARLQDPELTPDKQAWCRSWTTVWCVFFVFNGTTAALLGWLAPLSWWAFYTGLLAYVFSGLLLLSEWLLRWRRFGRDSTRPTRDIQA